jgi:putative tricarboxylic transport membrane protein
MLTRDRLAGGALALLGLSVLEECRRLGLPLGSVRTPGPAYMPVVLALLLLLFGLLVIAFGGRSLRVGAARWSEWRHAVAILVTCVFAALALERLGYRLTITAALLFLLAVVERKGLLVSAAFAIGLAASTHFLFYTLLRVPLPRGPAGL